MRRLWLITLVAMLATGIGFPYSAAIGQENEPDPEATIAALQTEVARLETDEPNAEPVQSSTTTATEEVVNQAIRAPAESEDSNEGSRSRVVNVELVLDATGSMAQVLPTGETRMEAAKRVLNGVIATIPERDGVNVGLRIYGHEGDNTGAGQAQSCESSALVVPIRGVDKDGLQGEIENLEPTGWTPIGLSLEEAREDFPEANDTVVNAIVLVTDGLETCGGNPAAVAGRLRNGDRTVTTNVIGFALTPDEQQVIGSIAQEGDGLLFGAGNADELSDALFSVLEELEIVTGTGYVGGNAFSLMPAGELGEVSVVTTGRIDQFGGIPFVLRNNMAEDVASVSVTVTARDAAGNLVGVVDVIQVRPTLIPVGGLAFGVAQFGTVDLPLDATFDFDVQSPAASDAPFTIFRDLEIDEASLFEDRIVGVAKNGHDETLEGLIFAAICFDLAGSPLSHNLGSSTATLDPEGTQEFQVTILSFAISGIGCPAFLVAGTGF